MSCFDGPPITVRRGDHAAGRFTVKDKTTGNPVDLTGWQKFWLTAKRGATDTDVQALFQLTSPSGGVQVTTPVAGIVDFEVTPAQTAGLESRMITAFYDFQGKDPAGKIKTLTAGLLTICPDVTLGTT